MTEWGHADAQPRRQFLSRAADGIFDRARAGRGDYGEADKEGAGGDGSGGGVRMLCSISLIQKTSTRSC